MGGWQLVDSGLRSLDWPGARGEGRVPLNVRITGGALRGRTLRAPRVTGLRPTADVVRAAIFAILGPEIVEGARVLDLYAGTGAMGIEALSRRAAWADFVEANGRLARGLRDNLRRLSVEERSRVYGARVEATLAHLPGGTPWCSATRPTIWRTGTR